MKGCQHWHVLKTFHCGFEYYLPRKKTLTKVFWLADRLSQAILFFNSFLPSMMEHPCSETDAVAFWVGVTAVTFSVVTMVTWQKQRIPIPLRTSTTIILAGLHCLWAPSSFSPWEGAKPPRSAFLLSVNPGTWFWEQQGLAESVHWKLSGAKEIFGVWDCSLILGSCKWYQLRM